MILQALCGFYDRMAEEYPEDVAQPGYAVTSVSRSIVLDCNGNLLQILDLTEWRDITGKNGKKETKPFPSRRVTPQQPKRSGRRPEPAFLCENANFLFGIYSDPDGADYRFEASRAIHETVLRDVEDEGACAVLGFFSKRKKGLLDYDNVDTSRLEEGGNIVFQLEDDCGRYIHERPAIQEAWERYLNSRSVDAATGQCLVTGKIGPIARIHGNLDGFGQDKPTLVGFNQDSFVSYRKEKGDNAPVSESAAFKYVTALNLLIGDKQRSINLHGDKVLYWAEKKAPQEEQLLGMMFEGEASGWRYKMDELTNRKMSGIMDHLYKGTLPEQLDLNENVRIYLLGLSTNKTRVVIRYFYVNTFGQLVKKFRQHYADIYVEGPTWEPKHPSINQIMLETAVRRESKNVPVPHRVAFIRSIMAETPYPDSLLMAMLSRIRAEASEDARKAINRIRIGVIKGYLNRIAESSNRKERIGVELDPNEQAIPYLLGQVFAILNKAQFDALEKVNASIVDKYLNAALASPEQVFPSLLANSEHHFSKSKKYYPRKLLLEVMGKLPADGFPKTLNAAGQGQFLIGFYHQQQEFFKGKDKEAIVDDTKEAEYDE
ncbi:type I-C CRISPR-associated protein Cas8c/Csd1 [Cohnella sp. 56]|uniref:type I-C CRISPR-associated protein Cas8c/Csd1 n=1 Tax=Cohnella sp. 56 TaxID=3113722 RepID=UPI0030E80C07